MSRSRATSWAEPLFGVVAFVLWLVALAGYDARYGEARRGYDAYLAAGGGGVYERAAEGWKWVNLPDARVVR